MADHMLSPSNPEAKNENDKDLQITENYQALFQVDRMSIWPRKLMQNLLVVRF